MRAYRWSSHHRFFVELDGAQDSFISGKGCVHYIARCFACMAAIISGGDVSSAILILCSRSMVSVSPNFGTDRHDLILLMQETGEDVEITQVYLAKILCFHSCGFVRTRFHAPTTLGTSAWFLVERGKKKEEKK